MFEMILNSWAGYACLAIFVCAYLLVIFAEKLQMRKSKPVIVAGTLMWGLIAVYEGTGHGAAGMAEGYVKHVTAQIVELFFFVFVVMTYINVLQEHRVFDSLGAWLVRKRLGYRSLFWATGGITFLLSPITDNLTSALLMATVVSAVGGTNRRFIVLSFISIIIASNAGGVWSPFGDLTSLMVWTSGKVHTAEFTHLLAPAIINWVVPAAIFFLFVPGGRPAGAAERVEMKPGAWFVILLGIATLATAICFHQILHLPPFLGMMLGLGYLMLAAFFVSIRNKSSLVEETMRFDIFTEIQSIEFDTLLFFFGIITAVGALGYIGHLAVLATGLYGGLGSTNANIAVGFFSAFIDNIPVIYAVLLMDPSMGTDQWLLVTLTAGVGGSLLSVGSAAGVALMGMRRDVYTFTTHLKWTPVVLLGYIASIAVWWVLIRDLTQAAVPH